jgi:hypothetical protein
VSALRAWHAQQQRSDRLDHQLAEGATLPIGDRRALEKLPDVKGKLAFAA